MSTSFITEICIHAGAFWFASLLFLALDFYWRKNGITNVKYLEGKRTVASLYNIGTAAAVSLLNQCHSVPFICLLSVYIGDMQYNDNISDLAIFWSVAWHYIAYVVLADQWFYWTHRYMHVNKSLFSYVHSIHHEWTHPMAISTMYAHPLEHIVVNLGAILVGPFLLPMPMHFVRIWGLVAMINSMMAHSGIKGLSASHDIHHRKLKYNFGVLDLSDRMYDTYSLCRE